MNVLFGLFKLLYSAFDKTIYALDSQANNGAVMPNWFMTGISTLGLGFQLLIMAILLVL